MTKSISLAIGFLLLALAMLGQQAAASQTVNGTAIFVEAVDNTGNFSDLKVWLCDSLTNAGYKITSERRDASFSVRGTLNAADSDVVSNIPRVTVSFTLTAKSTGNKGRPETLDISIAIQDFGKSLAEMVKEAIKKAVDSLLHFQINSSLLLTQRQKEVK